MNDVNEEMQDVLSAYDVFIPYDKQFIRKVVMGMSVWRRYRPIPIATEDTPFVPGDERLLVREDGSLIHLPAPESLFRPLVVVNSEERALSEAAMELAFRLGCPACEMWPERKEIVEVMVVAWKRFVL